MAFPLLPFIGQLVTVQDASGPVEGRLVGLTTKECTIELESGATSTFPLSALESGRFHFPTFEDSIKHLSEAGEARHCASCYIALLYAVGLLSINFEHQAFLARSDLIKRGVISFLAKDFPSAGYSLLPQAEGIATQVLQEDGLLKQTHGFPVWTKEHPDSNFHGKSCKNIVNAVNGAAASGDVSRLRHVLAWLKQDKIEDIRRIRNKLLHGTMLDISEHEVSSVVLLIQALHHGVIRKAI